MPSHWMRGLEATACAGRIWRCNLGSSWSCDAAPASMAAANRANRGPGNAGLPSASPTRWSDDCATRAGPWVGDRDRRVSVGTPGAGPASQPTSLAPTAAPTVLRASVTRVPETCRRSIPLSHRGSIWRSRVSNNGRKLRVEPRSFIAATAVESAACRCASNATELFALGLTASFAASCLARTFLALDLLQMPVVFIRCLILRLEPEPREEKRVEVCGSVSGPTESWRGEPVHGPIGSDSSEPSSRYPVASPHSQRHRV
jgi:hypothetical protein